jgi:5-methylcytosine-specific restriction endonuclease McrA
MALSLLMQRDGSACGVCGRVLDVANIQIDHIQSRTCGGTNEANNLQLTHKECNAARPRPRRKADKQLWLVKDAG